VSLSSTADGGRRMDADAAAVMAVGRGRVVVIGVGDR